MDQNSCGTHIVLIDRVIVVRKGIRMPLSGAVAALLSRSLAFPPQASFGVSALPLPITPATRYPTSTCMESLGQ